jgi:hypothetical protein
VPEGEPFIPHVTVAYSNAGGSAEPVHPGCAGSGARAGDLTSAGRFPDRAPTRRCTYAPRGARDGGDAVVRGETGDQTDQESRSAGHRAASRITAMDLMTSPVAYWHVPDIEAKLAEVTAAGATVKEPAHDVGGGRLVATVTDPDGNVLGLLQDR